MACARADARFELPEGAYWRDIEDHDVAWLDAMKPKWRTEAVGIICVRYRLLDKREGSPTYGQERECVLDNTGGITSAIQSGHVHRMSAPHAWKHTLVVGDDSTMILPSGVSVERIAQLGVVATDVIYGLTPQDIEFAALYVEEDQLSAYGVCTCFNRKCAYSPCKGECGCSACNSACYDAIDWD